MNYFLSFRGHIVNLVVFKSLRCRTEYFRNSFLPFTVDESKKLDSDIKNSDSYAIFGHNFTDTVNPLCSCTHQTKNTDNFFLRCQSNLSARTTLMNELNNISNAINFLNSF